MAFCAKWAPSPPASKNSISLPNVFLFCFGCCDCIVKGRSDLLLCDSLNECRALRYKSIAIVWIGKDVFSEGVGIVGEDLWSWRGE